jgi:hypothetical protein
LTRRQIRRLDVLEAVASQTLPCEISYDWSELAYQDLKAGETRSNQFTACLLIERTSCVC